MIRIIYSKKFLRAANKLSKDIQDKIELKENIFRNNPFDSRLKTHKLHGKDKKYWAYSITGDYRIKFLFLDDDSILYLHVGTHDEVY